MPKDILLSNGRILSADEAAAMMKLSKSEFETASLVAQAVAEVYHDATIGLEAAITLSILTDQLLNKALLAKKEIPELPLPLVMAKFGITEEQARIVTYFMDATTSALVAMTKKGLIPSEATFDIARALTTRTKAAFANAALDTIGEVQGHA